jgi:[acyl-carrier-protein] S-malonyltransferase
LVISGTVGGVTAAGEELKKRGCKRVVPLAVSAPFHSTLLKSAGEKLAVDLAKITIHDPKFPYVANVNCEIVQSRAKIADLLVEQVWKPVRWAQSLGKLAQEFQPTQAIEVGPGKVICGHLKKIAPDLICLPTDMPETLGKVA